MAGYTRQSSFTDGDVITAAHSNDEFNQILAAFVNTSGHKHDGTAAEGPVIGLIGDPGVATPLNKVVVDNTNPDGEEQKGLVYGQLTAVLTKALQEAIEKIETLEAKVAKLEE